MNIFDELAQQYYEIDNQYSTKEFEARAKGWNRKEEYWGRKRVINDEAYFLFMFTRLEGRIKQLSDALIISKKGSITHWKTRGPWDILPTGSNAKISFKNRLALLTDKSRSDFSLATRYYEDRNSLAHGGNFTRAVNMVTVINDMQRLYIDLKP